MPMVLNAIPNGSNINPALWVSPNCPPWFNTLNMVGQVNRLAFDQYNVPVIPPATLDQYNGGSYTSDYRYGAVFSDSGTDPSLPVRIDVFVWRNFDINKDFAQNQKPVGHMTGYIKRP
jgi:hypothetical protein